MVQSGYHAPRVSRAADRRRRFAPLDAAARFWHCIAAMTDPAHNSSARNLLPALTLIVLLLLLLGGWFLFPRVQAYMTQQDCIASGRTNCVQLHDGSSP
jgi:hypothetical protein